MNKLIDIQSVSTSADTYGQPIETWTDVTGLTNLYCSMITTGGREYYAAQKLYSEVTAVFKLRYISGITVQHRVQYGSRYFHILCVNNVNEHDEFILLYCKEVI